jgi:hypothetical protein
VKKSGCRVVLSWRTQPDEYVCAVFLSVLQYRPTSSQKKKKTEGYKRRMYVYVYVRVYMIKKDVQARGRMMM